MQVTPVLENCAQSPDEDCDGTTPALCLQSVMTGIITPRLDWGSYRYGVARNENGHVFTVIGTSDWNLVEHDASGNRVATHTFLHPNVSMSAMRADSSGILIAGACTGDFAIGNVNLSCGTGTSALLARVTHSGALVWSSVVPSLAARFVQLDVAGNGDIYVSGIFEDTLTLGSSQLGNASTQSMLIAKFTGSGQPSWASAAHHAITKFDIETPGPFVRVLSNGDNVVALRDDDAGTCPYGQGCLTITRRNPTGATIWQRVLSELALLDREQLRIAELSNGDFRVTVSGGSALSMNGVTVSATWPTPVTGLVALKANGTPSWFKSLGAGISVDGLGVAPNDDLIVHSNGSVDPGFFVASSGYFALTRLSSDGSPLGAIASPSASIRLASEVSKNGESAVLGAYYGSLIVDGTQIATGYGEVVMVFDP
jgi:hypothetical protein